MWVRVGNKKSLILKLTIVPILIIKSLTLERFPNIEQRTGY